MKLIACLLIVSISLTQTVNGQQKPEITDKATSSERAREIISKLNIKDDQKKAKLESLFVQHYDSLKAIFSDRKRDMDAAENSNEGKELIDARSRSAWDAANGRLNKLHAFFLGKLSVELTPKQNELVKDLMTEHGLQREYNNYLNMFPKLTELQKSQVLAYLKEARENAMNAETAKNRLDWFIKFRGRANNFLAAAGYDLRKATEEIEARKGVSKN